MFSLCEHLHVKYIKGIVSILQVGLQWAPDGKFLENHFHPLPIVTGVCDSYIVNRLSEATIKISGSEI